MNGMHFLGLICVLALVTRSFAQNTPGVKPPAFLIGVGTSVKSADVIKNDDVAEKWQQREDEDSAVIIPIDAEKTTFYIHTALKGSTVKVERPFVFAPVDGLKVSVQGPITSSATVPVLAGDAFPGNESIPFDLVFKCEMKGTWLTVVTLRFTEESEVSTLKFSFSKECPIRDEGVDGKRDVGAESSLTGLMIGTNEKNQDVMEDGTVKPSYRADANQNHGDVKVIDADSPIVNFFARWTGANPATMTLGQAIAAVEDPTVVEVDSSGLLSTQSTELKNDAEAAAPLSLKFNCLKEGASLVTVSFQAHESNFNSRFSMMKICAKAEHEEGLSMPGLSIGTTEGGSDIILDGLTSKIFRNAQSAKDEANKEMREYGPGKGSVKFYLSNKSDKPVSIRAPLVTTRSLDLEGRHVARPVLSGSAITKNQIEAGESTELEIEFNCVLTGATDITVRIPLKPSGAIQFVVEKTCSVSEGDAVVVETRTPAIPGLNVGLARGSSKVVIDGIARPRYSWSDDVRDLYLVSAQKQYITFFISLNKTSKGSQDVRLGAAELISTLDVASPVISGSGSDGFVLTKKKASNNALVSITFHCLSNGTTQFDLLIPVLPLTVEQVAPRTQPLKISFLKTCSLDPTDPQPGLGGVGITGFSIGTSKEGTDIVFNGFPQPSYFGQRNKADPMWDKVTVNGQTDTISLFLHYNSATGIASDVVGDSVEFQPPMAVSHGDTASPILSGPAAEGGSLVRDEAPQELVINFHCQYAGFGAVTIKLPILPHGIVTFTVPKVCEGEAKSKGDMIPGFDVKTKQTHAADVVKDGITNDDFLPYLSSMTGTYIVDDADMVFYAQRSGDEPLLALEPLVFAHRPIANPTFSHNAAIVDKKENGPTIKIWEEEKTFKVMYNCVFRGETAVTMTIPIFPSGEVSWTWTVVCGDEDYYDWAEWSYEDYDYFSDEYFGYYEYDDDFYYGSSDYDYIYYDSSYYDYGDYYDYYADGYYSEDYSSDDWAELDEVHWNPGTITQMKSSLSVLGYINVGTAVHGKTSDDVVSHGVARTRYALSKSAEDQNSVEKAQEDLNKQVYTVISKKKRKSSFWLSVPSGHQSYDTPQVKVPKDKKGNQVCKPTLSGPASFGGNLTATDADDMMSSLLNIEYNCIRPGVTPVLVFIPLYPHSLGFVSFRVIKVCGNFQKRVDWYWTAPRVLILIAVTTLALGSLYAYRHIKQNKSNPNGFAAPEPETAVSMDEIQMDDDDDDSD